MSFKTDLKERMQIIENLINKFMPEEIGYQKTIFEAMNYSLKAGGKKLRPILLKEAYELVGGKGCVFEGYAVGIEMIHTYSLIHDDLPALDNDDLRRGKPTNHKCFGEAMAILAGDALLNYAYEIMLKSAINAEDKTAAINAIHEIAFGAGIYGMIGGQVVDVQSEDKQIDKDTLDFIHKNKTGAMIRGCMRAGAILGGATKQELDAITIYSEKIGLAFQIADDILDVEGDEEKIGKKVGSDVDNKKSTYPVLVGIKKSKKIEEKLIFEAKENISIFKEKSNFLCDLAEYIIYRNK